MTPTDLEDLRQRRARGMQLLSQGRWTEGFALFDAWRELPEWAGIRAPPIAEARPWRGEPLAGKRVLVWSEEGLGDQIMYARFVPLLQARGASVAWVAQRPIYRLLGACLGVEVVLINTGQTVPGEIDYYVPSSQLPVQIMSEGAELPSAPYLKPPPANVVQGLTVGVKTRGFARNPRDAARSLPDALGERLLTIPGAVDLDPDVTGARDLYDTASIISGLDLVVSVDTSVAHLAGAMGKPVWILLDADPDWRWTRGQVGSPWYPSARLFWQSPPGDWAPVVAEVIEAARRRAG